VVLGLSLNIPHFTYVYLSHAAIGGHGVSYSTVVTMVSIEKFGYGFGFVGNMIYMMQQLAPGRSAMTHYAFADSLMNLILVSTIMVSGPLAEMLGFSTYFLVVMVASVPSVWAAWKAPLNHDETSATKEKDATEQEIITVDDPSRLSQVQRAVQLIAGRASIYAMFNILAILVIDTNILGTLQGRAEHTGQTQFMFLLGSAALKIFLTQLTYKHARLASIEAQPSGETAYLGNARGAKIATLICAVVSAAILVFGYRQAF
jgi:PAT family beta-lactamase induction signal transducer AmpG